MVALRDRLADHGHAATLRGLETPRERQSACPGDLE